MTTKFDIQDHLKTLRDVAHYVFNGVATGDYDLANVVIKDAKKALKKMRCITIVRPYGSDQKVSVLRKDGNGFMRVRLKTTQKDIMTFPSKRKALKYLKQHYTAQCAVVTLCIKK